MLLGARRGPSMPPNCLLPLAQKEEVERLQQVPGAARPSTGLALGLCLGGRRLPQPGLGAAQRPAGMLVLSEWQV